MLPTKRVLWVLVGGKLSVSQQRALAGPAVSWGALGTV